MANKRGQGEGSISKRPDGTWWARITLGKDENGKQKRKAFYGKTRKEVQEKLTIALDEHNKGVFIDPSRVKVSGWLETWMRDYKKNSIKQSSYMDYFADITYYINPYIGDIPLVDLRPDMVQKMISQLVDKGLSASTIQRAVMVLKNALVQAVNNGMLYKNPVRNLAIPKRRKDTRDVFTSAEQERFLKVIAGTRFEPIYLLILGTGLRIGEALALTWEDVNLQEQLVSVNKTQTRVKDPYDPTSKEVLTTGSPKTISSKRIVPLIPVISSMLKEIKKKQAAIGIWAKDSLIFPNSEGEMLVGSALNSDLKKRVSEAGIEKKITMHCLRHTFATRGLEKGVPLKVMQEFLGHSSIKMTADLYTHVLDDTKRNSIQVLSDTVVSTIGTED